MGTVKRRRMQSTLSVTNRPRRRRRVWRRTLALVRQEIAEEQSTARMRRLEVAAATAAINLLTAQRDAHRRSVRRSEARLERLRRDLRRGARATSAE